MTTSPLKMTKKILIIGSGFSSISAATYLADKGYDVTVFEKNSSFGGRARKFEANGFTFDMGPSWYWMPDVFEKYFNDFGKSVSDFYNLKKLDPAYRVYFGKNDYIEIEDSLEKISETFEKIEKGASKNLLKFMAEAKNNYSVAMEKVVYKPGKSILELVTPGTIRRLRYFTTNIKSEVSRYFKNKKLRQLMEFPVLFLGAKPEKTPAFYNIMNHADFGLGTWFPEKGGMYKVVESMINLAKEKGVKFKSEHNVEEIIVSEKKVKGVISNGKEFSADIVISGADYNHTEKLIPNHLKNYDDSFWDKKVFAPSSLLFYLGLNKKVKKFFDNLGTTVEIKNESLSLNFWTTSSMMAPFYEILNTLTQWLIKKGVKKESAQKYITSLFVALSEDSLKKSKDLKKLVKESQTPKGLNEQSLKELKKYGFYKALNRTSEKILKRLKKVS